MDVNYGIAGKKYLVTGASSGIGQAAAIYISKLGGKVVLNGRDENRLNQTLTQMDGNGHLLMPFDLVELDGIKNFVMKSLEIDNQKFDGMVFAAGGARGGVIRMLKTADLLYTMYLNFFSYAFLLKELCSKRVMNSRGSIVALSSRAAAFPGKSQGAYAGSKAAMDAISEVAAKEFANRQIRVNTIRLENTNTPSPAASRFFKLVPDEKMDKLYPLGALETNDLCDLIVFLLSDLSKKITGQHIYISGGNFGSEIDFLV